ncbi:MAG: homocysteine S-methyltransferase family protein [Eubacteriaceae bacterium]|jgi:5-methyltetrahydrofolate--homocysteine methyltransferase|nr:homocysteine S-methyltransferase family protein [Eubacteriaceae bacterium]
MTFLTALKEKVLCLDGAMGSQVQNRLKSYSGPPDFLNLTNPETIVAIHREYVEAGADVVLTNTFNTNPFKKGMTDEKIREIIPKAIENARASGASYVLYDMTTLGKLLGVDLSFEEAYRGYLNILEKLDPTQIDGLFIETMADLNEAKVAVLAAKATHPELPIVVSMTYDSQHKTLTGSDPTACAMVLEGLGVQGIGVNCSTGPENMVSIVKDYRSSTSLPIFVKPNAGMPKLVDGENLYDVTPQAFAEEMKSLLDLNIAAVGGCCGTTPAHIRMLMELVKKVSPNREMPEKVDTYGTHFTSSVLEDQEKLTAVTVELPTSERVLSTPGNFQRTMNKTIRKTISGEEVVYFDLDGTEQSVLEKLTTVFNEQPPILKKAVVLQCKEPEILESFLRYLSGKPIVLTNQEDGDTKELQRLQSRYAALWLGENRILLK